jgi:hypothetical protein
MHQAPVVPLGHLAVAPLQTLTEVDALLTEPPPFHVRSHSTSRRRAYHLLHPDGCVPCALGTEAEDPQRPQCFAASGTLAVPCINHSSRRSLLRFPDAAVAARAPRLRPRRPARLLMLATRSAVWTPRRIAVCARTLGAARVQKHRRRSSPSSSQTVAAILGRSPSAAAFPGTFPKPPLLLPPFSIRASLLLLTTPPWPRCRRLTPRPRVEQLTAASLATEHRCAMTSRLSFTPPQSLCSPPSSSSPFCR